MPGRSGLAEAAESWLAGQSVAIERLRSRATHVGSEGSAVVAIHGDAGAGKLRVAQWIHRCSSRSGNPLLVLDSDDPTLKSQLDRVIRVIAARARGLSSNPARTPGTLVLRNWDRAEEPALARLFEILGCQGVELVCALVLISKRSADQIRGSSTLHAQLLARAGGSVVSVPALRHRGIDIQELARHFANEAARRYDKSIRGISPQALSKLEAHDFPGNVRELQVMVEQAVLRSTGDWVTGESFWGLGEDSPLAATEESELVIRLPGSSLREIEIQALRLALKLAGGRVVRASELLGITRHALRRKLEKFGLNDLRVTNESSTSTTA
ncbi:helix-turn-helix domain-containing protein [Enhygromyxa salina]|uniref:helix-turn-helix domain-containing protein n=1 Tax=Enhygromyxa salina TaxID=215803 RepID=UPI0013FD07C8|nr:helix-turn-helix domain-containing protein [Enhygromyxa salina]